MRTDVSKAARRGRSSPERPQARSFRQLAYCRAAPLGVAQKHCDPCFIERETAGRPRLTGEVGVPDLQRARDIATVVPKEPNGVVRLHPGAVSEPGERLPLWKEVEKEGLAIHTSRSGHSRSQRNCDGEDGAVEPETLDGRGLGSEIEVATASGEAPDDGVVQFDEQLTHRRPPRESRSSR